MYIIQKLLLWNKKQNDQKTFLLLLTDFQILKIKHLFVSLSSQNLRLEIPNSSLLESSLAWQVSEC